MAELLNFTAYSATTFGLLDKHAHQFDLVVISATFEALPGQRVRLAEEQVPVRDNDEFYGEPGLSSVRHEGEVALEKPFVDILINGRAYAPGGRKAERVMVSVRVGDLRKELLVSGDRDWRPGLLGMTPSSPQPFETMPIVYERAFGGIDARASDPAKHYSDQRNPLGVGFQGAPSSNSEITTAVPNIEYPSQLLGSASRRPEPAGFGVIGRNWQPRIGFAGTYDERWKAEQWPLLPLDFDSRHNQAAPLDQQLTTIQGGEPVEVVNMIPEGTWRFTLPSLDVPVRLQYADRAESASFRLDTLILEPDVYRVTFIGRSKIPVIRNRAPLEEIIVGHVTPAWWRARVMNKHYLDWSGRNGRLGVAKDFRL
jgi:hypothetical protein